MKSKPYAAVRPRTTPGITYPVRADDGVVVDANGNVVATTFAPTDLDWPAQDKFRAKMAVMIAEAMNHGR